MLIGKGSCHIHLSHWVALEFVCYLNSYYSWRKFTRPIDKATNLTERMDVSSKYFQFYLQVSAGVPLKLQNSFGRPHSSSEKTQSTPNLKFQALKTLRFVIERSVTLICFLALKKYLWSAPPKSFTVPLMASKGKQYPLNPRSQSSYFWFGR